MIGFNFIKIFFFSLYLIIQIKSNFIEDFDKNNREICDNEDSETTEYTTELDFALCPCNLHRRLCDFNCCCDPCCNQNDRERFTVDCDIEKKNTAHDKFKCENRKHTYEYQNTKALIESHDHIFSLMCIKYDRTKDMGEFYIELSDEKINEELESKIKEKNEEMNRKVNGLKNGENEHVDYNVKINANENENDNFYLFQSDSFGNCVRTLLVKKLEPIEKVECGIRNDSIDNQTDYLTNKSLLVIDSGKTPTYENFLLENNIISEGTTGNTIKEYDITFIYQIDGNQININDCFIRILYINRNTTENRIIKQKFSVNFLSENTDRDSFYFYSGLPGYLQNKPVIFRFNETLIYENGIQIQGANPIDGSCLLNIDNNINMNDPFILFKVDTIYTCKLQNVISMQTTPEDILNNYKIFNNLRSENNEIIQYGQFGFVFHTENSVTYENNFATLNVGSNNDNLNLKNNYINYLPVTQVLEVIVSKFGLKGSSQEYIYSMKLYTHYEYIQFDFENPFEDTRDIELKFIVKFVSINQEQFEKHGDDINYKSSLIPVPKELN